jgi:uncharacterized protein
MEKERFYKSILAVTLAFILVTGLIFFLKKPPQKPKALPPVKPVTAPKPAMGNIAIVIDDVGYNNVNFKIIEGIKYPITFSVLPGLSFSEVAAKELSEHGFQIILHLPMEPKEKTELENNTILTSMDEKQIRSIIDLDLATLPEARGINNHMGSKVTEDARCLSIILDELKSKHMFFLDSFVTSKSVARAVAQGKKIKFAQRDVFLDNSRDPVYIRKQIARLKLKARQNGQAIGIGHDRKATLEVLKQDMPEIEKEGFKFVFVSELAR